MKPGSRWSQVVDEVVLHWSRLAKLYAHPSCRGQYCIYIQLQLARLTNIPPAIFKLKGGKMEVPVPLLPWHWGFESKLLNSGKKSYRIWQKCLIEIFSRRFFLCFDLKSRSLGPIWWWRADKRKASLFLVYCRIRSCRGQILKMGDERSFFFQKTWLNTVYL